ncbi:Protein kinase-like domain protein [Cordyceps fumosorosea ARSEF 2679]|uniref:Protein kinase-like domain protein n=1 Tax=Cordyceps fumosorosea (strain ARSEF 2679) TaxID=1081104 RepID=A0A168ECZ2_CORFA|nr:Protein kinase-like domain protein [Cordyceps fumosorosea ARSEF 2679]OAA73665.1 Protein kinase-like domain protein [Cordyceps fumosorosea ARSEF 2679]
MSAAVAPQHRPGAPNCAPQRAPRQPDWNTFYKNGLPKEVIVIEDSPEPPASHAPVRPVLPASATESGLSSARKRKAQEQSAVGSVANGTTNGSNVHSSHSESNLGRKRRRVSDRQDDTESSGQASVKKPKYAEYKPPRLPARRVLNAEIRVVHDEKSHSSTAKVDDEDGHFIIIPEQRVGRQYRVEKLLGQGTFGKVVKAYDMVRQEHVALKIIRSIQKYRDAARIELRVLQTLRNNDPDNRYRCIHPRDSFDYKGHICITMGLLDSSIFDFLKANNFAPFPNSHIQSMAHQLLTSVAFLHDLELVHTDLKPENILLQHASYQAFTYSRNIPSVSTATCRQVKQRRVLLQPDICLIDFGSATFEDEYHSSVVSTRHYRAPEVILSLEWSYPCDIWSIGCILVELFTGDALFQTHENREHLAMMEAVCGRPIDRALVQRANKAFKSAKPGTINYFKRLKLEYPVTETTRASRRFVNNMKKLEDIIPPTNPFLTLFLDLLRKMFAFDPNNRITAKEALRHPWFQQSTRDDGTEAARLHAERTAAVR